jgi:hypothetical protein
LSLNTDFIIVYLSEEDYTGLKVLSQEDAQEMSDAMTLSAEALAYQSSASALTQEGVHSDHSEAEFFEALSLLEREDESESDETTLSLLESENESESDIDRISDEALSFLESGSDSSGSDNESASDSLGESDRESASVSASVSTTSDLGSAHASEATLLDKYAAESAGRPT